MSFQAVKNQRKQSADKPRPLVSVVIPFYNIKQCVTYCLDSVLAQDFTDFEVVCVDDGSTDGTGILLDEYASHDSRVGVIHKENGGQGSARNLGVAHSLGRYVTFIDGDDVVSPAYLSSLVEAVDDDDTMVLMDNVRITESQISSGIKWPDDAGFRSLSVDELLLLLLFEGLITSPWARLAPKKIYECKPFPEANYEDVQIAPAHLAAVHKWRLVNSPQYGYVQRAASTVHSKSASLQKAENYLHAIQIQSEGFFALFAECDGASSAICWKRCLELSRAYRLLSRVSDEKNQVNRLMRNILSEIRHEIPKMLCDKRAPLSGKLRFVLLSMAPNFYLAAFDLFDSLRGHCSA